jgi:hypothetical protein
MVASTGALPLPLRGPSLLRFSEPSAYGDAAAVTPPGEDDPGSRCLNGYRYDELRPRSARPAKEFRCYFEYREGIAYGHSKVTRYG